MEATQEKPVNAGISAKKKWLAIGAAIAVAVIVAAILIIRFLNQQEEQRQAIIHSGVFHEGITAGGVSIGGMTREEALAALRDVEREMAAEAELTLSFEGEDASIAIPVDASAFGFTFDTEAVLEQAMALGREGSLQDLTEELADIAANGRAFALSYTASEDALRAFAQQVAAQVNTPAQDARFVLLVGSAAEPSPTPETDEAAEPTPSPMPSPTPSPTAEGDGEAEPLPPTAQSMGFCRYEPDIEGLTVDEDALCALLLDMAERRAYADAAIPMALTQAQLTLEALQSQLTLRASASTSFAKSPYYRASRVFNMAKAAGLINGTVLQPGEEFSTNGILGDRTYAAGWKDAPAIVRGRSEDQAGGGVCQVSTTLYNAVLKGDLEVVFRQGHSGRLGYIEAGLDATIDSGRIDFKWKNNTDAPLYIFSWVDETQKRVYFELYGKPLEYDEIQLSSARIERLNPPGEMTYQYDYALAPGETQVYVERKSGSVWQSYATYIKDGEVVEKKKVDTTTYKAYAGVTLVGPPAGYSAVAMP